VSRESFPAVKPSAQNLPGPSRRLTAEQFQALAEVPAVAEWLANIENERTRRAYKVDLQDFMGFVGIERPDEFRSVNRAHVIAWRKELERRGLAPATIRRKLSAMASLFDYLCEKNSVPTNPVDGVKRPGEGVNEGKTPSLGDAEARQLLEAPDPTTLKGKRDRAILAVFLYHGLRSNELSRLCVSDIHSRRGVIHFRIHGKGSKIRFVPSHPAALARIKEYLDASGHEKDQDGPLFRPVRNTQGTVEKHLTASAIYDCIVMHYAKKIGIAEPSFCVHSLRATAATNALENASDIAKVQEWLGHASVATTRLYDKRKTKPEDSPTFKVRY
jgi:site-specific recombinase XerD